MPNDLNMYSEAVQRSAVHCMGKKAQKGLVRCCLKADEVRQTDSRAAVRALNRTNHWNGSLSIHSVLAAVNGWPCAGCYSACYAARPPQVVRNGWSIGVSPGFSGLYLVVQQCRRREHLRAVCALHLPQYTGAHAPLFHKLHGVTDGVGAIRRHCQQCITDHKLRGETNAVSISQV
jgi:hypothetical protein